jgi:hypothetical protein
MAKRRKSRRRIAKSRKSSKLSRNILVGLGLVLPVLWVVFTKTMFDPFEAPAPAFSLVVPRDVDLFAHRESLGSDLDLSEGSLPAPVILQRWMRTLAWRDFAATSWATERGMPSSVEELIGPMQELLTMDTGPLDIVADLMGEEFAVVGRDPWTAGHFAFMFRLSTKAKLAVEALDFLTEGTLQGATRTEVVDEFEHDLRWWRLDLQDGTAWHYFRHSDLLVVGNHAELVADVQRTVNQGSELSMGLSRLYRENVPDALLPPAERFSTDFSLDLQNLINAKDLAPDTETRREDAVANILPKLVDVELLRDGVGRLEVDKRRIDLELFADVAGDGLPSATRGGVQGGDPFLVHERLKNALTLLPRGTAGVQVMNVDLTEFLESVVEGLDPELVTLMNDTIRGVSGWTPSFDVKNMTQLIAELDRALDGRLTIAFRALDHEIPAGAQPVPAIAFIAPIKNLDVWDEIAWATINGNKVLGVASGDMWEQKYGGLGKHKFLPLPATSAEGLSWIELEGETLVFTTDPEFTHEIIEAYGGRGEALAAEPGVAELMESFERRDVRANVAAWVDARQFERVLEPYAEWRADLDTILDFGTLRAQERREILRTEYPQYLDAEPPADLAEELEARLDTLMDEREAERQNTVLPELARAYGESWGWLALLKQGAFSLRIGDHTMGGSLHLETVVD